MPNSFAGFSSKAITFLRQLKKNNSREWFAPRKDEFESLLRQPMLELTGIIADQMRGFAVDYVMDAKRAVHQIYRDVRFSKDKSPYKTNISAMFWRKGLPKNLSAGFYYSLSGEAFEIAGGLYMPGPEELAAVRRAIADDPARFSKQIEPPTCVKLMGPCKGDSLTRDPKGYEDHPAAALLRRKQFYYFVEHEPKLATQPGLDKLIVKSFKAMAPMIEFVNQIFLESSPGEEPEERRPKRPTPMF
jgi:uncharacterized protein (TIGR02453 family)